MSYKKSPFEQTPRKNVNLTRFDRSHEYKTAMQPGYLIPCLLQETLPMDRWRINSEFMFRFNPMYFPIMHKMTMRADYFYIPNRILWPGDPNETPGLDFGWKRWITEQPQILPPLMDAQMAYDQDTWNNNVLGFMGIPLLRYESGDAGIRSNTILNLNAFPLSAYLAIWDEYYRVPQLETTRWFPLSSDKADNNAKFILAFAEGTPPLNQYYPCLSAKWQKDYFTSALPSPQYSDAVQIPMTDGSPLAPSIWLDQNGDPYPVAGNLAVGAGGPIGHTEAGGTPVMLDIQTNSADIRDLRIAEVLQSFRERIMKIGTRYRDYFKGLWGGDPEPGVVDVPILFGSTFGRVQVSDVMSTALQGAFETGEIGPGDYGGQANLYTNENEVHEYTCREHGFIMCIVQVNPNTSYGQGIHRLWRRDIQTDYALDMFSGIGDQEILKEEVLYNNNIVDNAAGLNQDTFGYIERFAEYKYQNDIFTMQLAWDAGLSQHLGRVWYDPFEVGSPAQPPTAADYTNTIEINQEFINTMSMEPALGMGDIRITDVWRVLTQGPFSTWPNQALIFAHIFHSISVDRALPLFSTPKLGI